MRAVGDEKPEGTVSREIAMSSSIDKIQTALADLKAPWCRSDLVVWVADLLKEIEEARELGLAFIERLELFTDDVPILQGLEMAALEQAKFENCALWKELCVEPEGRERKGERVDEV